MARKPRKRNYRKLYETYLRRRRRLEEQGKILEDELDYDTFALTYESMYHEYLEQGYDSPTKNIIQNIVNSEIFYDWSFEQARGIQKYLEENGYNIHIYDIRHGSELGTFQTEEFKRLLSEYYQEILKEHPEWNVKGRKKEAAAVLKNIFFGDSK